MLYSNRGTKKSDRWNVQQRHDQNGIKQDNKSFLLSEDDADV